MFHSRLKNGLGGQGTLGEVDMPTSERWLFFLIWVSVKAPSNTISCMAMWWLIVVSKVERVLTVVYLRNPVLECVNTGISMSSMCQSYHSFC